MKNFFWQAPEYGFKKKTSDWYWTVGIISTALVVTAVIFGNILFAVVIAIGSFSLALFASRRPDIITVAVGEKGIAIDKTLYLFSSLDSFSVDEDRDTPRLFLKSKKVMLPLIAVPLAQDMDADDLRAFLASHLKEETFEPGLIQTLFERMGF